MGGFFDDVLGSEDTSSTSLIKVDSNNQLPEGKPSGGFFSFLDQGTEVAKPEETPQQILNKPQEIPQESMLTRMVKQSTLAMYGGVPALTLSAINDLKPVVDNVVSNPAAAVNDLGHKLLPMNYLNVSMDNAKSLVDPILGQVGGLAKTVGTLGTEVGPMKYLVDDHPDTITAPDKTFGIKDYFGLLNPYKDLRIMGNTMLQAQQEWRKATGFGVQGEEAQSIALDKGPKEALTFLWNHPQAQSDIVNNFVATGLLAFVTGGGSLEGQGATQIAEGTPFLAKLIPSIKNAAINPMTHVVTAESMSSSFNQRYEQTGDLYGSLSKSFVDGMGTFAGMVGLGPVSAIEQIPGVPQIAQGFVTTMTKWLLSSAELTGFGMAAKEILGEDATAKSVNEFWLNSLFSIPALEIIGHGANRVGDLVTKFNETKKPNDISFYEGKTNISIVSDLALVQEDMAKMDAYTEQAKREAEGLSVAKIPGNPLDLGAALATEFGAGKDVHAYFGPISSLLAKHFNVNEATFGRFSAGFPNEPKAAVEALLQEGITVTQKGNPKKNPHEIKLDKLKDGDVLLSWDIGKTQQAVVDKLKADLATPANFTPKEIESKQTRIAILEQVIQKKKERAKAVQTLTNWFGKTFGIDGPIVLSDRFPIDSQTNGWIHTLTYAPGKKINLIALSPLFKENTVQAISTHFHELSHAFGMEKMQELMDRFGPQISRMYLDDITQGTGNLGSKSLIEYRKRVDPSSMNVNAQDAMDNLRGSPQTYPFMRRSKENSYQVEVIEWFANKMARAILRNEPGTFGKDIAPIIQHWQETNKQEIASVPGAIDVGPLTKNDSVFMNMLKTFQLERAVKIQKAAVDMTKERQALLRKQLEDGTITRDDAEREGYRAEESPKTPSVLWGTYFGGGYEVPYADMQHAMMNKNIPEMERRALADVIHTLKLDRNPEASYQTRDIAHALDQALQFRYNEQAMFNKLKPWEKVLSKLFGNDPKAPEIYGDVVETGKVATLFNTLLQLTEKNPNHRYLRDYTQLQQKMSELRLPILNTVTDMAMQVKQLLKPSQVKVQEFFRSASRGQVVDVLRFEMAKTMDQAKVDKMSDRQVMANWGNYENTLRTTFKLSKPEWEQVKSINERMKAISEKIKEAELEQIQKNPLFTDEATRDLATKNLNARFRKLNTDFYLPEMRFGEHVLVVRARGDYTDPSGREFKDGQTIYREHFETKSQRDKAWQIAKTIPEFKDNYIGVDTLSKNERFLRGLPLDFLFAAKDDIKGVLEQRGIKGSEFDSIMRGIDDLIKSHSADNSYTRRLMQRNNIDGGSNDLPRILAAYGESASNHYARTSVRMDMEKNFNDFENYYQSLAKDTNSYANPEEVDRVVQRQKILLDYMKKHRDYVYNPGWEFEGLKNLGFIMSLGFNAKSALVNLTSLPLFTHSFLASKFGDGASAAELSKAMKDVMEWRVRGKQSNINEPEMAMMEVMKQGGLTQQTIAKDAATLALSSPITRIVGGALNKIPGITQGEQAAAKISEGLHSFSQMSGWMFQYTENYAREVAGLAAMRLAKKAGVTDQKVQYDFARQTINTSLFEYSRWNRPAIMRGAGSPLFLFQQFGLNALYFATRKNSAAIRFAMGMFLAGGLMGLPVAEDAANLSDTAVNLAKRLSGSYGQFDTRTYLRELFSQVGMNSDMIMNGAARNGLGVGSLFSAAAGDGSNEASFDISKSLSQGRLLPFNATSILRDLAMGKRINLSEKVTEGVGGAAGNVVFKTLGLLEKTFSDQQFDIKDLEKALPTAIGSAVKAGRLAYTGVETDNNDIETRRFDINNPKDLADIYGQALNFSPQRDAIAKEKLNKAYEQNMYWMSQRAGLLEKFRNAYQAGLLNGKPNALEIQRATEEVMKFNKDAPGIYAIGAQTIKASIRSKMKDTIYQSMGYVNGPKSQNVNQYDQLYPEGKSSIDIN